MKTQSHPSRRLAWGLTLLAVPLLLISCASNPVAVSAVGPKEPARHWIGGKGYLVVYSDTEPIRLDKGIPYYVHTGYLINQPDRQRLKWVANHVGDMDQAPQVVSLPTGTYQVVAQSAQYGRVYVPVVIEAGQTTKVHLEGKGSWTPQTPATKETDLVRFPDGELVGWQAAAGRSSTGPTGE